MEWRGKYAEAMQVPASPMLDAPVLYALGRTPLELFLPVPLAALGLWRFGPQALLFVALAFFALPRIRVRWGRNRLLHALWGRGHSRLARLVQQATAVLTGVRGDEVPTPFSGDALKRYGP